MINKLINNERFYYGWIIVAVCFICWLMTDTLGFYTFGLFMGPMSEELGWTTFMITLGMTIKTGSSAFLGPVTGFLADKKYGARLVMTFGILAAGASLLLASNMQSIWQFYLFYGIIGAIGQIGFGGVITHTIIAKWFVRMRGRAMGMATMGVSISGLIFIPFNHYMISNYGWRFTMMIGGLIIWCVALAPTVLFIRRRPEDVGLKPDGDHLTGYILKKSAWTKPFDKDEYSWTLKDALRTRAIWLLLAAFNVTGISIAGVMIHYYAFSESKGISPDTAAFCMTAYALCAALVKVPWGFMAERFPVRSCNIVVYGFCALGLAGILIADRPLFLFMATMIYGAGTGGLMVIRELLFADYYGRAFLGTIRGIVMPVNAISIAIGPTLAAWLRDTTGNYFLPYAIFFSTFIAGIVFMYFARPPEPPGETA